MHARSDFEPARRARPSRGRQGSSSGIRALAPSRGPPASFRASTAQTNARGGRARNAAAPTGPGMHALVLSSGSGPSLARVMRAQESVRAARAEPPSPHDESFDDLRFLSRLAQRRSLFRTAAASEPPPPGARPFPACTASALCLRGSAARLPEAAPLWPSPGDLRARPGGIHSGKSLCWRWMIRAMLYRGERGRAGRGCGMRSD
jgi:hypothetical protein